MNPGRESTKDEMLEAGVRVFRALSTDLLRGLTAGLVADEAGYHRQTFYRYWDTQAQYVDDLVRHLLTADEAPTVDGLSVLSSHRPLPVDPVELARDVARYDYEQIRQDPAVAMRVGLVAMQALEGEVRTAQAQAHYEVAVNRQAKGYVELLEHWGRECRPPFTPRELARVHQALLVGLLLADETADDDPTAAGLFELTLGQILLALTVPVDD